MINSYMPLDRLSPYLQFQKQQIEHSLDDLDPTWIHATIIKKYCIELKETIDQMLSNVDIISKSNSYRYDRKKDKYTSWVEVMRLALFQYERFAQGGLALSEGLYASLIMSAATWNTRNLEKIVVLGCGPGRSVLDFSKLYPMSEVEGLDYSLFSLMLAEKIICGSEDVSIIRRDVFSDNYSEILSVPGMSRKNVTLGLIDLGQDDYPQADMIICSNVLNLLPNHRYTVNQMYKSLNTGGIVVFADLLGWRLDREAERKEIRTKNRISSLFTEVGFTTLDQFEGVPYIESESKEQYVLYKEHFYIGRKEKC